MSQDSRISCPANQRASDLLVCVGFPSSGNSYVASSVVRSSAHVCCKMSTENDGEFVAPKKNARKRVASSNDNAMEIEYRGIAGEKMQNVPTKKRKPRSDDADVRKVPVPAHRYTPLKESWLKIFTPIVENLQLQVRFNLKTRNVEIRSSGETPDIANLQKAADFVRAFVYGFDVDDALALLRLDNLFIESFEVKDVKTLKGDHLSRAIGRLAGKGGRTKFTIENITKTRIVLADSKIHILGSYQNIQDQRILASSCRMHSVNVLLRKNSWISANTS